jgi:hypothetical protein
MEQLVEVYGRFEAIRLDNGPEFTAEKFVEWAQTNGVQMNVESYRRRAAQAGHAPPGRKAK